jgi:Kef-type K+ transport system membrane component KefB
MSHIVQLFLLIAVVVAASKTAGHLSTRLGQPAVFGEILVGLVLGPSVIDILGWSLFLPAGAAAGAGHPGLGAVLRDLAEIGVVLLMFVAGMETDMDEMRRVGKVAFWAAVGGVVLPLGAGAWAAHLFGHGWSAGLFMGAVLTATSVSISAQTLMEIGSLRSKEGSTILGAAVIDDVLGIIVLSIVVAFTPSEGARGLWSGLGVILLKMTLFFVAAWFVGRRLFEPALGLVARLRVSTPVLAFVVVVALVYAWGAEHLGGVAAITGSYLAGVLFARTSFRAPILAAVEPLTYSLFVPVFFVNIGLQADIAKLGGRLSLTLFVLVIAILGKVIGCGGAALLSGFTLRESYRVGVGMISRGEVGLIVAGYGLAHGIIGQDIFSVMVLMVLVTTMVTPLWLRFVFPRGVSGPLPVVGESVAHLEREDR